MVPVAAPAEVEAANCVAVCCGRNRDPNEGHGRANRGRWGGRREEPVIRELDSMKQREGTVNKGDHHPAMDRGVHGNGELVDPCPELGRHVPGRTNPARDPFGAAHRRGDRDRLRSDEKVVVLSNSVTLRSKPWQRYGTTTVNHHHLHSVIQMTNVCSLSLLGIGTETAWLHAQGLPCEGAKEFRESLMDPSSRRFMWAASAPQGSAWSCLDASALAENYYNSHHHHHAMKRTVVPARPAQAAKGLNRRRNDG
ncbi:unnamed protein product [Miscanthus lutarioriparius]|uniref:Uncharacterized protein n=1 Tax=Miscanthus lutarioriparius TaxID=422564 RepID=A0A811P154_9POAL|nr:unnamed protein product [Miscanthus lutarioriparius]